MLWSSIAKQDRNNQDVADWILNWIDKHNSANAS
jgi:hypothetical protein